MSGPLRGEARRGRERGRMRWEWEKGGGGRERVEETGCWLGAPLQTADWRAKPHLCLVVSMQL